MISIPSSSNRKWIYELNENNARIKKIVEVFVKPKHWENRTSHIVLPFSIQSRIYNGIPGDLKIKSLLKTVKSYAKNKVLILLSEGAHLNALSIKHGSYGNAFEHSKNEANSLLTRFKDDFAGCEVAFWEDFIWKNPSYIHFKDKLQNEYIVNQHFRSVIQSDVEKLDEYFDPEIVVDSALFQEKSRLDLLEMLTGFMVMHDENYKVVIYPGSMPNTFTYLQKYTDFETIFINASIKIKNFSDPSENNMLEYLETPPANPFASFDDRAFQSEG
jgi:hypothetical protein